MRMQYLLLVIKPRSAFATPLKGDTLFGQLCWALRDRLGESNLRKLLQGYTEGRPFAVVSDALPERCWPRPVVPPALFGDIDPTQRKATKEREWLPQSEFDRPIGEWLRRMVEDPRHTGDVADSTESVRTTRRPLIKHETRFRNSIDRRSGTTGDEGFAPYGVEQFRYREGTRLACHIYRCFETDPMRLVHVADAMSTRDGAMDDLATNTAVAFAINRKKRKITGKDGQEVRSQAERKGLYQVLEIVPALRWRVFQGGLTLNRTELQDGKRLPKSDLRWTAPDIAGACNRFYRPIFGRDTEAMRERGLLDERWYMVVQRLMEDGLGELLDSNRAFMLRVGRHSGAESVTLDGVRDIRIMTPQGQPRWEEEATTWWLASDRIDASSGLLPFGWVLVELTKEGRAPASRPQIAKVIDSFHAESGEREWRAKVMQRVDTLRQEQEAAASRRTEADRRQREQEEAQRKREAKRAAMTNEERELDDLRTLFDKAQQPGAPPQTQGGELAGRAIQLIRVAKEWPEALRLQAAELVEEIFRTVGFPKGKRGRERKQQIQDLREDA